MSLVVESRMGAVAWAIRQRSVSHPTGSPEAVARPRLPQNVACGFPAPRSSTVGSQLSLLSVQVSFPWSADLLFEYASPCSRLSRPRSVGSEEAPIEGLASVRHSNGTCSFPAFRFHEWLREVRREGISETRLPCPPESGPSASDLRTSNDRIVSSKRDVRVFHKGNFPSSRSSHLSTSIISSPESLRTAPRPSDVSR